MSDKFGQLLESILVQQGIAQKNGGNLVFPKGESGILLDPENPSTTPMITSKSSPYSLEDSQAMNDLFGSLLNKAGVSETKDRKKNILDLIGNAEANGKYNIIYGGDTKNLANKSVDEVLALQDQMVNVKGLPSTAVGKYQFINKTLKGLKEELGLTGKEKFTPDLQDKLATVLLKRRGYDDFKQGKISKEQFMKNLSMEWASLPKDSSGKSFYAGDGLNKALVDPNDVLAMLR